LSDLRSPNSPQRNAVVTSFLGWSLDAFDFAVVAIILALLAGFGVEAKGVAFGQSRHEDEARAPVAL
jgi:hypothetical protein